MDDDLEASAVPDAPATDGISPLPEQPLRPEEARVARQAFLNAFSALHGFDDDDSFTRLMGLLDVAAKPLMASGRDARSINSALAKMHGDWFEWLLCWVAEDVERSIKPRYTAVRLPNVMQYDAALLYQPTLARMLEGLRSEVQRAGVELITSNPDFAIIRSSIDPVPETSEISSEELDRWMTRFRRFTGLCDFEDIRAYLAAKYTLRPDRRLQMPHEGSLMKALYVHLQTRLWVTSPPGLRFYAVASRVGPADRVGLRTVATHSITSVASRPQAAVDHVFEAKTIGDARRMFMEILQ